MKTNHSGLGPKDANPTECNNTFVSSFFRSRNDGTPEFEPSQSGGSSEAYPSSNPTHWPQTSEGPATVAVAANGRHAPTPCVTALSTSHSAPGESIPYVPTYSSALLEKSVHGRVDQAQNQPTEAATSKPYYIPSGSTVRVLNVMGTSSSASSQTLPDPSSATKPSPSVRRALAANANLLAYIVPHHPNARVVHKVSSASRLIKGHRGCMVDITFTSEYSNFLLTMATDGLVLLHAIELRDGGTLHAVILGALQLETALSCTPIGFEPCVPKNARNEAESVLRHQVLIRTTWPRMKLFALHELSVPAVEAPLVPVEECDVPYMSLGERVGEFCVTTEGNRVAIVEEGTRVAIYLLPSPARHAHWSPHKGETVDAVAFSSTNCTLVTCASQCTKIHVWNVSEVVPQCVQSLTLDLSLVQSTLPNPKYRLHINSERTFAFFVLDGCAFATMLRFSHDGNVFDAAMDLEILGSTAHSIIATSEKSTMSDDWPLNHPGTVRPLMLLLRHDDAIRTITIERYALEELARRGASSRVIGEHGKLSHVVRELSTYGSVKHTRSVSPPHGSFSPITNQRDGAQSLGRDHAAQGIMNTTAESGKSTPHTLIHNIQPIPPRAHSGAGNPRELNTASSEARSEGMKNISSGTQWSKMPQVSPPVHHRATNLLNQSDDVDTNSAPVSKGFDFSGLVAKLSQQRTGNKVDALHSETAHSTSLASHAEGEPLHEKTAVSVNPTVGNPMCTLGRVALTKNHTVATTTTTVAAVSSSSANQNVNSTPTGMMPALASSSVSWLGRLLRQADGGSTVEASIKPSPTSSSISPSGRKRDALVEKIVGTSNEPSLVSMSSMTLFTNENVILSHGSDEHDQIVGSVVSDHRLDELLSASQSINVAIIDASKKVIELQRNLQELSQRRAGLGKSNATTVMTSSTQAGATNNTTDIPAACLRMISIMDHISSHLPAPLSEQKAKDTVAGHTGSAVQALHARIDDLVSTQLANYEKNWFSGVKQTFQDALHRLVMQENFVKKQLPAPEKIQHIEKMHAALDSKRITTVLAMILRVLALQTSPQARSEVKKLLYKNRYEEALNIMLEHRDAALLIEFIGCYRKAWKKFISDGAMTAFTSLALFQNLTVLIFMCPSAVPNKDPFFSDRSASILSQAGVISLMSNLAMNYFTSWEEQIHLSVYLEIRDRCIENLERFVAESKGMNSVPKPLKLRRIFRLLGRS